MPYKEIVKELKKLDPDLSVEITLDPGPKGYVEVCRVRAEYEGYGVSFDASFNYRTATLETNEMTVGEVIKLLKKKKVDKMTDRDFPGIANVCSTDSNSPEYEDVEWDDVCRGGSGGRGGTGGMGGPNVAAGLGMGES